MAAAAAAAACNYGDMEMKQTAAEFAGSGSHTSRGDAGRLTHQFACCLNYIQSPTSCLCLYMTRMLRDALAPEPFVLPACQRLWHGYNPIAQVSNPVTCPPSELLNQPQGRLKGGTNMLEVTPQECKKLKHIATYYI